MAALLGVDVSHHQGNIDWDAWARFGVQFAICKATEGSGFKDDRFKYNLSNARRVGILAAAYHYQRSNASIASQISNIISAVPKWCPLIPDVEANSGDIHLTNNMVINLERNGYNVPLLYLPRWYWQQIGSPNMRQLPPLWSSRYPDNVIQDLQKEYADVEKNYPHFWNGYGEQAVGLLQFTSSARVAGKSRIDGNAFRGTKQGLADLLAGKRVTIPPVNNKPPVKGKDDVGHVDSISTKAAMTIATAVRNTPISPAYGQGQLVMRNVLQDIRRSNRVQEAEAKAMRATIGSLVQMLAQQGKDVSGAVQALDRELKAIREEISNTEEPAEVDQEDPEFQEMLKRD